MLTCSDVRKLGLNKGEAHHALKNALRIGRQGEIRDRTSEGQHYRMAGLNLLARHHNILEHRSAWEGCRTAKTGRSGLFSGASSAHLTPWMGTYSHNG